MIASILGGLNILNTLNKMRKSKTVVGNSLTAAVVTILAACGVEVSVEVVTAAFLIGNVVLRFLTKGPLKDK